VASVSRLPQEHSTFSGMWRKNSFHVSCVYYLQSEWQVQERLCQRWWRCCHSAALLLLHQMQMLPHLHTCHNSWQHLEWRPQNGPQCKARHGAVRLVSKQSTSSCSKCTKCAMLTQSMGCHDE